MALSYSRRALEAILSSISSKPLSSSFWRSLCELGITRFKPTRRGCRAGVRKQRPLFTCEGPPLQSSTRSILSSNESCSNLSSSCERLHLYGNLHIPPSLSNSGILPSISNKPDSSKRNNNRRRLKDVPKNNRRKLICMTMNCRSAKNKIADIAGVIDQHKPDIIFGNESWLNSKIESNEIFPNGYKIFRKDRPDDCHGGGVFQAVKNDIITTHRSDLETDCEIIWTQCQLADKKTKSLLFGSYYRPNSSNVISLDELDASLLKLGNSVHKNNIIVSGDFNAPDISWDTGSIISDNKSKADILNNQFSSVFTQEDLSNIPDIGYDRIPAIDSLSITTNGVAKQLSLLKTNKASGPDAIPPWFLKEYAAEIAPILTNIFQDSIESGTVPSRWKSANVCGVFKKGKKSDPSNYRPISLTCIASKILEHIVHSHVMKHFEHYNILTDCQHGFRSKRSTELQLILTIHDIASSLQQNKSIHAAVLDFSKAFDKVPHQRLLMKLERYGIHGNLLSWMESFLTKRVQTVICKGATSPSSPVTSGVPQGSVLGPLLFLTYINDLPNGLTSTVKLFADDTLLYGVVVDDSDCDNLQDDLNKLEIWQHEWQMQFNPSKCNIICISNKQRPPQRTYFFCGSKLEQVDSASYLGITVNSKLKWSEHISSISSKASRSLGLIKRNLWNCPRKVRETAYTSIVRPKLEYASASRDPHFKKDISVLERVQRKAARFCLQNFNKTASVTHMLSDLNWDTLETRRKKNRLTLMYKLSHNLVDINTEEHLIPNSEKRTHNSHAFKYRMPKVSKDVFKFSFFPRSITEWNSLPADLVNCQSLSDFKLNLGKHLK